MTDVDAIASLDALGEEWSELARRSGNLFATPEWLTAWWRHFGEDRRLAMFTHRRPDGELAVLVPLYHARELPLRTLRFLGHGPGDWLGPIHAPGEEVLGAAALRAGLRAHRGAWDVLVAEQVPRVRRVARAMRGYEVHREGFPVLTIAGRSWDELLAARSANFRQQVRRRERKLRRAHDVAFRLADDPTRLDEDISTLLRLHDARWDGTSEALGGAREAFQREFAHTALARGWLRLWFLELDGRPVAAWYGFRYAGDEWYYQAGRDPEAD
ncbi:MAG TPA: GNAT family N-acetyltransferase, partial [Solirubrobacteraceae bacterium]